MNRLAIPECLGVSQHSIYEWIKRYGILEAERKASDAQWNLIQCFGISKLEANKKREPISCERLMGSLSTQVIA